MIKKKQKIFAKLKFYFLIINLIISILAYSFLIYAQTTRPPTTTPPAGTPPAGTNPPTGTPPVGTNPPTGTPSTTTTPPGIQPPPGTTQITGTPSTGIIDLTNGGMGVPPGLTGAGTGGIPPGIGTGTGTTGTGTTGTGTGTGTGTTTLGGSLNNFFNNGFLQKIITAVTLGGMIGATVGTLAGGKNGILWGTLAGTAGVLVYQILQPVIGGFKALLLGMAVGALIFIMTYKKESQENVEFQCLPWQAPIGGRDCQRCNELKECSQYSCKSLGQACEIVNSGTPEQKCIWKNPHDVNSPIISMRSVLKGHKYAPDKAVRPPATGIKITKTDATCIKAFTPLEFSFDTDEPSQCKIDYNLIKESDNNSSSNITSNVFENMGYFVGGNSLFVYNHTETMSLPSPDSINAVSPELKNNGEYTLFIRCMDANGNFNQDAFSVSFCVEKGPDTTPPNIEGVNIPSNNPIQFNKTSIAIEVYVNEPSECKWSRQDIDYKIMENKMSCDINVWEMNNRNVYTCRTTLTGIESRKENLYYFRCKDQPWQSESDRNINKQSYLYKVIGTQPLNIMNISPVGTITGATDFIPVFLEIKTDNGYKNGEALCYYSNTKPLNDESYVLFLDTGKSEHRQRQDLPSGNYTYYFKCVDLGGNSAYNKTNFKIYSDRVPPNIVRVYKEGVSLKIITNEKSDCSYSTKDCNFEIDSGIKMNSNDYEDHDTEWKENQNYYIRCKDIYNNQPNPNTCSIIVRATKIITQEEVKLIGS